MSMQPKPVDAPVLAVDFLMDPANKSGFPDLDYLDTSEKNPITAIVGKLFKVFGEVKVSPEAHTAKGPLAHQRLKDVYILISNDKRVFSHPNEECFTHLSAALDDLRSFLYPRLHPPSSLTAGLVASIPLAKYLSEADAKAAASDAAAEK